MTPPSPCVFFLYFAQTWEERQEVALGERIIFTYDVSWKESTTRWASRWDIYLTMNHAVKNRVRIKESVAVRCSCRRESLAEGCNKRPVIRGVFGD